MYMLKINTYLTLDFYKKKENGYFYKQHLNNFTR